MKLKNNIIYLTTHSTRHGSNYRNWRFFQVGTSRGFRRLAQIIIIIFFFPHLKKSLVTAMPVHEIMADKL